MGDKAVSRLGDTEEPNRTEAKRQVSQRGGYPQKWQRHVARGEGGLVAGGGAERISQDWKGTLTGGPSCGFLGAAPLQVAQGDKR